MRSLLLSILFGLALSPSASQASVNNRSMQNLSTNPLIRICNISGGIFLALDVPNDQLGFCQYGSAIIDAETVLAYETRVTRTYAYDSFMDTASTPVTACPRNSVQVKATAPESDANAIQVCKFDDGSAVELSTLQAGANDASTQALVKALKTNLNTENELNNSDEREYDQSSNEREYDQSNNEREYDTSDGSRDYAPEAEK